MLEQIADHLRIDSLVPVVIVLVVPYTVSGDYVGVDWREGLRKRVRDSRLKGFFSEYRPYEDYGPGPLSPDLASTIRGAGFSYMLSKSGFGRRPGVVYRDGDFVALNYTAGR